MSQKAVVDFLKRVNEDARFQKEFLDAVPKELSSGAPIVEFAARRGFEFTEKELEQAAATSKSELSEADLKAVAGGVGVLASRNASPWPGAFSPKKPGNATDHSDGTWETHEFKL